MQKRDLLYEGKAKKIFNTDNPEQLLVEYKDDATAFNGKKKGEIKYKGILNSRISAIFFRLLEEKGIETHLVEVISDREQLVRRLEIILVEVIVRNIAAGSLAERLGLAEGQVMKKPVLEFYYKNDDLGDPLINQYHIFAQEMATRAELEQITETAFNINQIMQDFLRDLGIELVDFKLEFGRDKDGKIYLADEISPDTCRFWDIKSGKRLDKDRFRRDLGNVEGAYQEIYRRLKQRTNSKEGETDELESQG